MKTINRTALYVFPKQPYIDWANSFDDGGPTLSPEKAHGTTFLIQDRYDEFNFEKWLKKNFREIFEQELESWMMNPDDWPQKKLTYKMFREWFEVRVAGLSVDMGKGPIVTEEY